MKTPYIPLSAGPTRVPSIAPGAPPKACTPALRAGVIRPPGRQETSPSPRTRFPRFPSPHCPSARGRAGTGAARPCPRLQPTTGRATRDWKNPGPAPRCGRRRGNFQDARHPQGRNSHPASEPSPEHHAGGKRLRGPWEKRVPKPRRERRERPPSRPPRPPQGRRLHQAAPPPQPRKLSRRDHPAVLLTAAAAAAPHSIPTIAPEGHRSAPLPQTERDCPETPERGRIAALRPLTGTLRRDSPTQSPTIAPEGHRSAPLPQSVIVLKPRKGGALPL